MGVFGRKMDDWAEDEVGWEELYRKLYGPVLKISLMFPSWKRGNRLATIIIILWYIFTFSVHTVLISWSIVLELRNYNVSILLFHYWLLILFGYCAVFSYSYQRKQVAENHLMIAKEMGVYSCGSIYEDDVSKKLKKDNTRETYIMLLLPVFIGFLSGVALFGPYIASYNRGQLYTENGVSLILPVPLVYPFETHKGIVHLIIIVMQLATAGTLGMVVVGSFTIYVRVAQLARYEFKIICYALETLYSRADKVSVEKFPGSKRSKKGSESIDQHCVGLCLRDCILHHQKLIGLLGGFETASDWPLGMAYTIGTWVIGLSLVNILAQWEAGDLESVITFVFLCLVEILSMFTISLVGESITSSSMELRDRLYFMEWHKLDLKNRKLLLNFQIGVHEPYVLKTKLLMNVNMDTFTTIMNSAYSFFNLMNTTS